MISSVSHAVLLLSLVLVLSGASVLAIVLAALAVAWELFLFVKAGMD